MTASIIKTPAEAFASVSFATDYPATILSWKAPGTTTAVDLHVVDVPSAAAVERGTFLLLHGEPSWSHLYHEWIGRLAAAGYRCVAPDLPGFGRSDKPADDSWYSYERHCDAVRHVIEELDLHDLSVVVQDWAGPIGLRQLVDDPERFSRAFIFNTWLHHDGYAYSDALRWWHQAAADPANLGGDMPTGAIVSMTLRRSHDRESVERAYDAPFTDHASKAGARAFPAMLPFARPDVGGAVEQQRCRDALVSWRGCPIHVAFSDGDPIFPFEHGAAWAKEIPGATLDRVEGAGHFVQLDAPGDCLEIVSRHLGRVV